MNFIALFMVIIGMFLIMIGLTIYKNKEVLKSKINNQYIKYKIFINVFVGAVSILTAIVQFLDSRLANNCIRAFLIVIIVGIFLDVILKRVYK